MIAEQKKIKIRRVYNGPRVVKLAVRNNFWTQKFDAHYLTKASCEITASSLKEILSKYRKSTKTHKLSIISH